MENPKVLQTLIRGVVSKLYFQDDSITPEVVKEQLLAEDDSTTTEALAQLFSTFSTLIEEAGRNDWDLNELQSQLQQTSLSEVQQAVLLRSWRSLKQKIHDVLTQRSQWNNNLKKLSWRVDVKAKTKSSGAEELNEPTAIVELVIGANNSVDVTEFQQSKDDKVVRLEMTHEQLQEAVYQINRIQSLIEKITTQS